MEADEIVQLPALVQEFARYKRSIQGCSVKTVSEYLLDLRTFCRFLSASRAGRPTDGESLLSENVSGLDLGFFESVQVTDVYEFLTYATDQRGNAAAARARKLSAIKGFYKYLTVKQHLTEWNPAQNIETPRKAKALPKFLSLDESVELLNAAADDTESKNRERDYAILTLFLNCGMRVSELAGISLSDVDEGLRSLRVVGKGAKERIIYLNDACREALKNYLPQRRLIHTKKEHEPALFISRNGNRMSVKTVQYTVYKYLGEAGLGYKHYSVHKLRHTAATLMYQSGAVDIRVLKDILGHEQLTTTQIYTHVSDEHMEAAMANNPLNAVPRMKKTTFRKLNEKDETEEPT